MLHNRRKAEIEVLASVPRKAAVFELDGDSERIAGHHSGSTEQDGHHTTISRCIQQTEPPSLIEYLVDKMNAIVDTYVEKYA